MQSILFFLFICFCTMQGTVWGGEAIALYLTWQRQPETTMTICWITKPSDTNSIVEYQREGENEWQGSMGYVKSLPNNTPYLFHNVEISNLQPDTHYQFRIRENSTIYKFRTMPQQLKKVTFVAGGDVYHDTLDDLHETNRQAAKTNPMFALIGGDIAYAGSKVSKFVPRWASSLFDGITKQKFDRWLEWLIAWKEDMVTPEGYLIPILPTLGNHDVDGDFGRTPAEAPFFYTLFPMPGSQGYNLLDFGNYMTILLLDSGHTHPIGGYQAQWIGAALEQRQHIPHKFALYHVPAYPSVRDFNDKNSSQIRQFWVPSFEKYHLEAAFENHDHAYKRSFPILNGQINADGVIYFGDGGWGVDKPRKPYTNAKRWYLAQTASARHFLLVTIESDKTTVSAIKSDGTLIDQSVLGNI